MTTLDLLPQQTTMASPALMREIGPLSADRHLGGVLPSVRPEKRSSGRPDAPGSVDRLASWLADACARGGVQSIPRREAQRLGPIREPADFESALTTLVELDRCRLVCEGKKRLITLVAPVDVAGAAPIEVNEPVAGLDAASVASVATGPSVATVATLGDRPVAGVATEPSVATGPSVATRDPKASVASVATLVGSVATGSSVASVADLSVEPQEAESDDVRRSRLLPHCRRFDPAHLQLPEAFPATADDVLSGIWLGMPRDASMPTLAVVGESKEHPGHVSTVVVNRDDPDDDNSITELRPVRAYAAPIFVDGFLRQRGFVDGIGAFRWQLQPFDLQAPGWWADLFNVEPPAAKSGRATGESTVSVASVAAVDGATTVATVADLSEADREWFEERAGIMEFDAGMSRDLAEAEARRLIEAAGRGAQ